ncbi:uncharacterized protein LOC123451049 [Hordeum vulgare subsp. vulgare]|uniref:Uncharacterized protein n=1 Tax=Hordeum vulgare subsp. vulgare TaxID=112509 RepID=A0A8I7B6R3_HORVV|nr:uncharacterized protein LOC123451049 [Hordeum vulgare subsp. vulgare]
MEHKGQLQPEKKSAQEEEEEAMAMAASSPSFFFAHPLSLLHHVTRGFAGYMGLSRLCHALKDLKPRAATSSRLHEQGPGAGGAGHAADDGCAAVQVRSRGVPQRPRGPREGRGGTHH